MSNKQKRYYWLKLKKDFFDQKEIKMLRRIAGGDTYTIIYLKMLLKSLENNGNLYFESIGKDFAEEMAIDIDEDTENVGITLNFLQSKGLLEIIEEDEFHLSRVPEMVGSEAFSTERARKSRANKKLEDSKKMLQCNNDATSMQHDATKRIEKEKELEKDIKEYSVETSPTPLSIDFETIWKTYPKKTNKKKAKEQFKKFVKTEEQLQKFIVGYKAYLKYIKVNDEWYQPQELFRWIRDERFNDEYDLTAKKSAHGYSKQPIRKEILPDWSGKPQIEESNPELEKQMEERLRKYQANRGVNR